MTAPLGRRDKQVLLDFETCVRDFYKQFGDQQRFLDLRTENKVTLITDLQEFFKRRSELDCEYGKNLDRLCDRFSERISKQRATYGLQKKDRASYVNLWSKLLIDAKFKAKTATTLSEIYSKNIVSRLTEIAEDIQRIAKSVKDTHLLLEVEIKKQINLLQNDMRAYYMKLNEFVLSKSKYRTSEDNMKKAEDSPLKKGNEKRLNQLKKNMDKRRGRLIDCQKKAINGRNEYILSVEAVASILNKYYHYDLSDIVMKYDHNFHNSFSSTLQAFIGAECRMANAQIQSAQSLSHTLKVMDAENDIKMFLEDNESAFIQSMKFVMIPHSEDEVQNITADEIIEAELNSKHRELHNTIKSLQVELSDLQVQMEKRKGGLDATYKKYDSEMNGFYHIDMTPVTGQTAAPTSTLLSSPPQQLKVDKEEWETGLLAKFKEKIMSENLQYREQAKYDALTKALGEIASDSTRHERIVVPVRQYSHDLGSSIFSSGNGNRTVKLFGTSLKHQLDDTGLAIPDIVESCAKYIARFGLKHQGIFRVPGASQEISDMKIAFEEGRDPLSGLNHWKDINAVAGVFRAYFREMGEPLFPFVYNQDYLRATSITKLDEQVAEAQAILNKIPDWNLHVIKYMLKFLNLISQYSEINKMTSHNLAVVFGPTLFRVADNENLLTKQGQINVFIDVLIGQFYSIFPDEPHEGDFDECDNIDSDEEDNVEEEHDHVIHDHTEDELSDEDTDDTCEAIALYDFTARSPKEVSFSKGDRIKIFTKTTSDWWDAKVDGKYGYVPVSYIKVVEGSHCGSRHQSMSESDAEHKRERKKSIDKTDHVERKTLHSIPSEDNDLSPPSINIVNNDRKGALSDSEDHCGNVFAAIDPTCAGATSPSTMKRIGSERVPSAVKTNVAQRTHSDKRDIAPRLTPKSGRSNTADADTDDFPSPPPSTMHTAPHPPTNKPAVAPPVGGKSMFLVSQQDLQTKLRHPVESIDDRPSSAASVHSSESQTIARGSIKEKSRAFSQPIMERPQSQTSVRPPILGHMQIESADRPSPVPSFKPPPPPPALKPKPSTKRKDPLPSQLAASAAALVKNKNEGKDVTHL